MFLDDQWSPLQYFGLFQDKVFCGAFFQKSDIASSPRPLRGNPTCGFPSFGFAKIHPFGRFEVLGVSPSAEGDQRCAALDRRSLFGKRDAKTFADVKNNFRVKFFAELFFKKATSRPPRPPRPPASLAFPRLPRWVGKATLKPFFDRALLFRLIKNG